MNDRTKEAAAAVAEMPGWKEDALIALGPCRVCGKPQLGADVTFYVVEVSRAAFDRRAIERRVGLQMMLGNGALAAAMGPNEDIAKVFAAPARVFVHESCAARVHHVLELFPEPKRAEDDR